ncbi:MAG: hypothetical protein GY827_04920 [Cytophagales bacterium]|nr:hypothetical protein [Cytophagales bacterium]
MKSLNEFLNEAKLSPDKQIRLDALIDIYKTVTDPDSEENLDKLPSPEKVLKKIEKEFGKKIADDIGR